MLPSQFGPFGEFVLGGGGVHFSLQANYFSLQVTELSCLFRLLDCEFAEDQPCYVVDVRFEDVFDEEKEELHEEDGEEG